jgi:hypothetical protein
MDQREAAIKRVEMDYMRSCIGAMEYRSLMKDFGYDHHWCDDRLDQLDEVRYMRERGLT